ncbi:tripartite tricarboxylate transporter substrate binding protein [Metabacillus sp. GX 13764]|uniref:Bug family tripartite tricarboxylate transporter substrate binding protein n=1 Tax=Metabacillus kandeliae TaxID=2900151 RepID=UPI001E33F12A|nr:tripartite tricarboxylate transporter substrate-binding protein [Metabacillus kandeliae]MCD7034283.1 tripartite tricarboxylate transporter substrate binding protein [Metabacillus kandeliae]
MKKIAVILFSAVMILALAACSNSQTTGGKADAKDWEPAKTIEIAAPSGAGGGWDTTARMAAKVFTEDKIIPKSIGVVNKPGGGGAVGWAYVHSQKDPYHLFVSSPPLLLVPLNGQSQFGYKDFTPIANMIADYGAIVVKADAKWNSLNDLFEDMKKDPSKISVVGASSPGSMDHILFVRIAKKAGVDIKKIKYVSDQDGGALTQLLNGSVQVYSAGIAESVEQVKAGKVKVLGITADHRLKGDVISDFKTAKEQGINADFINWRGFFGPPDMDPQALKYYEQKFKELSDSKQWAKIREQYGWDEKYMDSKEYTDFLAQQEKEDKALLDELGLSKN